MSGQTISWLKIPCYIEAASGTTMEVKGFELPCNPFTEGVINAVTEISEVIALDPGITSGMAYVTREGSGLEILCSQVPSSDLLVRKFNALPASQCYAIIEDFRKTSKTHDIMTKEIIGYWVKSLSNMFEDVTLYRQTSSQGKTISDKDLKVVNYPVPIEEYKHSLDALRHLYYWCLYGKVS